MSLLKFMVGGALFSNSPYGLIKNSVESFVDNVVRDKVSRPAIGSVVYCDLTGYAEHSGIYVGDDSIVHLDGSGAVEVVSSDQFLKRLGGFNTAISIYVSCSKGASVGSPDVASLAKKMIGKSRQYNLILDNCHQFTSGCLSGDFENSCNFFVFLKSEVNRRIGGDEWRVWDR